MEQEQSQQPVPMKENKEHSSTIINVEQYEETPFGIVETNKEGEDNSFVAIGNKRLTPLIAKEECKRLIVEKDWILITQLIMHITENLDMIKTINEAYRQKGI